MLCAALQSSQQQPQALLSVMPCPGLLSRVALQSRMLALSGRQQHLACREDSWMVKLMPGARQYTCKTGGSTCCHPYSVSTSAPCEQERTAVQSACCGRCMLTGLLTLCGLAAVSSGEVGHHETDCLSRFHEDLKSIDSIGTSDQPCWLAEACTLFPPSWPAVQVTCKLNVIEAL